MCDRTQHPIDRCLWTIATSAFCLKLLLFFVYIGYVPLKSLHLAAYVATIPGTALFIYSLAFLFRRRYAYMLLACGITTCIVLSQIWYFRYYGRPFSLFGILQWRDFLYIRSSLQAIVRPADFLLTLDVFALLFLAITRPTVKRLFPSFAIVALIGLLLFCMKPARDFYVGKPWLNYHDPKYNLVSYNVVGYQIVDLFSSAKEASTFTLSPEQRDTISGWFEKNKQMPRQKETGLKGAGKGMNLIVIQVEALGNFVVGATLHRKEITPLLNRRLRDCLYFRNIYAQNRDGGTSDAEFMLFTSCYPICKGSTFFRYPHNQYTSLPKLLKELNYTTVAFHGDDKSFWNRGTVYPIMGIDKFYDIHALKTNVAFGEWLTDDHRLFRKTLQSLDTLKEPFFSLVITLESHLSLTTANNGYFQAISRVDKALEMFLEGLQSNGLYDRSVIVLYGDHPPHSESEIRNVVGLNDIANRQRTIPFAIHVPHVDGDVLQNLGGHIDMFPTIAHIMGIDEDLYSDQTMGRNLLTSSEDFAVSPDGEYLSNEKDTNELEMNRRAQGLHIADLLIRADYFATAHHKNRIHAKCGLN